MGIFNFFKQPDINQGVEQYKAVSDAVLLDVRTRSEYMEGHIPGSKNIPLQTIDKISSVVAGKDIPIYVYCHSGSRSRMAAEALLRMGYTKVKNIGGITAYSGKVEQ